MHCNNLVKTLMISSVVTLVIGCSSTRNIPFTVQSDPLGAQVMLQVKSANNNQSDWIYLGNTPLTTQRNINSRQMNNEHSFVIRVMKEGFSNQTKEWTGPQVKQASKGNNRIFWNPKLIDQVQ